MNNNGKKQIERIERLERLLFEIRNELMSFSRVLQALREAFITTRRGYFISVCNLYQSKTNFLIAKINKALLKNEKKEEVDDREKVS